MKFKLAQGGSDVGVADVAAGRVTIGNSSRDPKPSDPGGLVFNPIAKDAICVVTNPANPLAQPVAGRRSRRSSPARCATGSDVPGATATGTIDLIVRTAASGTQDAFQKIFLGPTTVFSARVGEGVERPRPAGGAVRQERDRLRLAGLRQGHQRRRLQGRRLQPAQREVRPVRRRAQLLDGHARAPARASATQTFIHWVQTLATAQKIIGTHWVPLK